MGYYSWISIIFTWIRPATHLSFIQNESYQTPEKTKNNAEHEKRDNINNECELFAGH